MNHNYDSVGNNSRAEMEKKLNPELLNYCQNEKIH